jgi:hypothetical protein
MFLTNLADRCSEEYSLESKDLQIFCMDVTRKNYVALRSYLKNIDGAHSYVPLVETSQGRERESERERVRKRHSETWRGRQGEMNKKDVVVAASRLFFPTHR